ncbi:rhodanese-like domain-containing protein [Mycobacterium pseudokansasii]|uniref:rhodanese-like domain-containing protein n=1 Tax=Mycobacterium pseudokansasii TaxID=2341080 RepID=UPI0009BE6B05|nr:rhodanese-like domain-containing protein [Mycobacterium pseudokansasii]VAZ88600.1 hypothetical protein LAUMK35_00599 [Mycobacterium pseudokansasii]VAZ89070.1 hypothetical protein LAUMK21_00600 [Mycobacterium pseudokansasii]
MTIAHGAERDFRDRLCAEPVHIGEAISSGHRLEIIDVPAPGECTVDSLATATGLPVRRAQLVAARRNVLSIGYASWPQVTGLMLALRETAEHHLAEAAGLLADFLDDRDRLEPVTPDELDQRMATGDVVLLEARPQQEYSAGHITGAVSTRVADIGARIAELPLDKNYVAYCRGPYCVHANAAVRVPHAHGRRTRPLTEGFPEWRLAATGKRPQSRDRMNKETPCQGC